MACAVRILFVGLNSCEEAIIVKIIKAKLNFPTLEFEPPTRSLNILMGYQDFFKIEICKCYNIQILA